MDKMEKHSCAGCGQSTWHNPCKGAERSNGRCTYCGYPANGHSPLSWRKELAQFIQRRQAAKAGRLTS